MGDWPQQIGKPKTFGNFKKLGPREKQKNSNRRKEREGMDDGHAANIRLLPCCLCRKRVGGEIHHLKHGTGQRGMGLRSPDMYGVPVCRYCHEEVEAAGTKREPEHFQTHAGLDPLVLASRLWAVRGDVEQMHAVLKAHWQHDSTK